MKINSTAKRSSKAEVKSKQFERFEQLTKSLLAVSKSEIQKRESEKSKEKKKDEG